MQIKIPRTRNGAFTPLTLELIQQHKEQVQDFALLLYKKGLSSRDVSETLEEYFGESMSRTTINNLAESFHEIRKKWEAKPLDKRYKVVYSDALYVSVKRNNNYSKEAVYVIYGVKADNTRELLHLSLNPTEGANVWGESFEVLKARGVLSIDLIVSDGIQGFEEAVLPHFPKARYQCCVVHKMRSLLTKVRPKDKVEFSKGLTSIFDNFESGSTKEEAYQKLEEFKLKWQQAYPVVRTALASEKMAAYFTYIDFPKEVRRMIYTTNTIENLNRQIRKVIKTKVTFDKPGNLLDLVFMVVRDYQYNKWTKYPVHAFKFLT